MLLQPTELPGSYVVEIDPRCDNRGYFARTYDSAIFGDLGLSTKWLQENEAFNTGRGIVRGLHFQAPPHAETKLVRVVRGAIWDVILDIRRGSPTFGQWRAFELSEENRLALYVPRGFAHGYCTLSDTALVLYKVDARYAPEAEGGVRYDDPVLEVPWPTATPLVSDKDKGWPTLAEIDSPFQWE